MRKRILNQPIDTVSMEEATYRAKAALMSSKQFKIITLNPEMVVTASNNLGFQAAINNANLIIPDGTGIVWALKLLNNTGYKNLKRIPGIELAEKLLGIANKLSKKVAIFGGKEFILEKAVKNIKENYPNLYLVKAIDGYKGKSKDREVAEEIARAKPDLVLVALGSPYQEIWINKFSLLFPESVMVGVGGSLDIWSGKKKRAPEWMRKYNLEWFYRVISEPQRVPRILKTLPVFVLKVLLEAKSSPRTKQAF